MTSVVLRGHFEAAHMLSDYDGACRNLHGHSYHYEITLTGEVDKETGMVEDFNNIKKTIDGVFDHSIIFATESERSRAEQELYKWADTFESNYVVCTRGRPTCENIAHTIADTMGPDYTVSVVLWETSSGRTMVTRGPLDV